MKVNKFLKHFNYYLFLLLIFVVGFILTLFVSPNLKLQFIIIGLTIVIYVAWGILHHRNSHELTSKITIEYLMIGLLGLSIVFFIFMGGIGI